jgi:hypothetical protein
MHRYREGPTITLSEWLIYYLETYLMPDKPADYHYYWDICFRHLLPSLGQVELRKITSNEIQDFIKYKTVAGNLRTGGPLSDRSVKNIKIILEMAMEQALADGLILENPVL